MGDKVFSVAKGAAIAGTGAVIAYLSAWFAGGGVVEVFGPYAPIVVAGFSVGVNALRKFLGDDQPK